MYRQGFKTLLVEVVCKSGLMNKGTLGDFAKFQIFNSKTLISRLRTRLGYISEWAYQQGLELAAECHMDRINQAVALLVIPKTVDQISNLGATCYKLNSIQVQRKNRPCSELTAAGRKGHCWVVFSNLGSFFLCLKVRFKLSFYFYGLRL